MEKNHVYEAIAKVSAEMAKEGIGKSKTNSSQGYKFRGIDDIYNALSSVIAKNNLVIIPRVLSRHVDQVTNAKGTLLFYVTIEAEYDFVSAIDGSSHTARTVGEAMDSGDKATNKAMSAAHKYLLLQTFCIPTEGDNDTENQIHEIKAVRPAAIPVTQKKGVDPSDLNILRDKVKLIPEDKKQAALIEINNCLTYEKYEQLEHRLDALAVPIDQTTNPSQKQINKQVNAIAS